MSDNNFPKGLFYNKPSDKAPDFVQGDINIKRDSFIEWLRQQDESVKIDLLISREGKGYARVNDWKPDREQGNSPEKPNRSVNLDDSFDDMSDDLPFSWLLIIGGGLMEIIINSNLII